MNDQEFPFVVASLWRPDDPVDWENLSIYTYGHEVQFGTLEQAINFKRYVERMSKNNKSPHKIYKITFEEINENV